MKLLHRMQSKRKILSTIVVVFAGIIALSFSGKLLAQVATQPSQQSVVIKKQSDLKTKVMGKDSLVVRTKIKYSSDSRPLLGVYLEELDFETAYKMHYDYTYGVMVDGVVSDGAAETAGIMEDDIIMEFNGTKVRHEDHLVRLIRSKRIGDQVPVKFFRDGTVKSVTVTLQGADGEKAETHEHDRRIDAGDGGFTFYGGWYEPDHQEISSLIQNMGFSDVVQDPLFGDGDPGLFMRGFQFQFEGDNNWYWGFDFNSAEQNRRSGDRWLDYEFSYWGFLLQKRIPVFQHLILDGGFSAGTGSYNIKLYEINQNYQWNNIGNQLDAGINNYVELEKNYLIAHPSASVILRFTDWVGLRGNVGYLLGYSYHTKWNAKVINDDIEVKNSPETSVDGLTYSVGLWFDFF